MELVEKEIPFIPNCPWLFCASGSLDALPIGKDERRWFVFPSTDNEIETDTNFKNWITGKLEQENDNDGR